MVEDLGACDGVEIVLGGEIEKLCVVRPDCRSVPPGPGASTWSPPPGSWPNQRAPNDVR